MQMGMIVLAILVKIEQGKGKHFYFFRCFAKSTQIMNEKNNLVTISYGRDKVYESFWEQNNKIIRN